MRPVRLTITTLLLSCIAVWTHLGAAQSIPYERTFSQSKLAVEKALKELQPSTSGRLPVLDGFTRPGDHALDRFQRGYYQCAIHLTSTPSGGTVVRISAKITAWYEDPASSKSGYQELPSNGRLETDFLDRLEDALGGKASASTGSPAVSPSSTHSMGKPDDQTHAPASSGRLPTAKASGTPVNSPFRVGNPTTSNLTASLATQRAVADKHMEDLTKEAKGLEEILRNQAHPNNLVAVKSSGTPVLVSPVEGAKVLFLAAAEDEFEILDMNANWVHVRISGLSRGWIRRSTLELPKTFAADAKVENPSTSSDHEQFQVKDEQVASFPGTWEPLRGQTVKIVTVQNVDGDGSNTGSRAKLEFAKFLFAKEYAELTKSPTSAAGVVLIFDSQDGGMVAATLPTLQLWKAGTLSDQAFWRRCFFDPPETFISQSSSQSGRP